MKALVGAFNQEKALVGAFSVIVQPVVEPMEHYTALVSSDHLEHTFADIVLRYCGDRGDVHQDNQRRYKITRYGLAWFPPLVGGDQPATLQL